MNPVRERRNTVWGNETYQINVRYGEGEGRPKGGGGGKPRQKKSGPRETTESLTTGPFK